MWQNLCRRIAKQNQTLQEQVMSIQRECDPNNLDNVRIENIQSMTGDILIRVNLVNFNPPPLDTYDGKRHP